jgi:hypothetical protein
MFYLIASAFASAFTRLKATNMPIDKMTLAIGQNGTEFKLD